jgi:hypothetical protein
MRINFLRRRAVRRSRFFSIRAFFFMGRSLVQHKTSSDQDLVRQFRCLNDRSLRDYRDFQSILLEFDQT